MPEPRDNKFLIISCALHVIVLLVFIVGFDITRPPPVVKQSYKNDVISAVVLGDSPKSKILPHEQPEKKIEQKVKKVVKKPEMAKAVKNESKTDPEESQKKTVAKNVTKKKAIGLETKKKVAKKKTKRKKVAKKKKPKVNKKQHDAILNDLLADIKSNNEKKIKAKKEIQKNFSKMLKQQSEKSLRQHLLDEEIKLKAKRAREMRGIVNKYQALIRQQIGQNWIVPTQSDRSLTSELMIRLAPGGVVLDVKVIKSSGDPALDNSAKAAVMKSSPLLVPKKADEFEPFRQFVLKVKPENVIENI